MFNESCFKLCYFWASADKKCRLRLEPDPRGMCRGFANKWIARTLGYEEELAEREATENRKEKANTESKATTVRQASL